MVSLNVSLPEQLDVFVQEQVEQEGFSNNSDYVRFLIREDWKKKQAKKQQETQDILNSIHQFVYNSTPESRNAIYENLSNMPAFNEQSDDEIMQLAINEIELSRK